MLNWLKSIAPGREARPYAPEKTRKWRRNELRPPLDLEITPEWTLRCPRNASSFSFWYQLHDPPQQDELQHFIELIKQLPEVSFLDVGCHFGLFTFAALQFGPPRAEVTAVDASRLALEMGARIASLNRRTGQVRWIHSAVGATHGTLAMVAGGRSAAGYFLAADDSGEKGPTETIPLSTVDELARQMPHPPTVIKVDVEGYESEVIEGAQGTLDRGGVVLCLEMHNGMMRARGKNPEGLLQRLEQLGYREFSQGRAPIAKEAILQADLIRVMARRVPAN